MYIYKIDILIQKRMLIVYPASSAKYNKVFMSLCYQRLNGTAGNFIVSVYNSVNTTV